MSYYFTKTLNTTFESAIKRATEELKKEGFGILTEIDVKETLKEKMDVSSALTGFSVLATRGLLSSLASGGEDRHNAAL